jgi:hypothetical protein
MFLFFQSIKDWWSFQVKDSEDRSKNSSPQTTSNKTTIIIFMLSLWALRSSPKISSTLFPSEASFHCFSVTFGVSSQSQNKVYILHKEEFGHNKWGHDLIQEIFFSNKGSYLSKIFLFWDIYFDSNSSIL